MVTKSDLTKAMKKCKGKKGCDYANCMHDATGKWPSWAKKKGCT